MVEMGEGQKSDRSHETSSLRRKILCFCLRAKKSCTPQLYPTFPQGIPDKQTRNLRHNGHPHHTARNVPLDSGPGVEWLIDSFGLDLSLVSRPGQEGEDALFCR